VSKVLDILESSGAKQAVEEEIDQYRSKAEELLSGYPENESKQFLLQWAEFACNRTY